MRYFFVSYGLTNVYSPNIGFANGFCRCEKAPSIKTLQNDMEEKSKAKCTVLNIQELTKQDYTDFTTTTNTNG